MDNIIQTLFLALLADNKNDNPFDTDATEKAFYNAYDKWVEMAEIEEDISAQNDAFSTLGKLEYTEREQAFKVGLQAAFSLIIALWN